MLHTPRQEKIALALLIVVCLFSFFYPILGNLNTVLLSGGGDGIKNYFNYLFYLQYNSGTHFSGMNYPYGENIIFTDNMPGLAWALNRLSFMIPNITKYSLVMMHSTFLLSYTLSTIYAYKFLKLYNVNGWWCVLSATFIAFFSPQCFRLFGHFGLSLSCFFSMLLYWIQQYRNKGNQRYCIYVFLLIIIFTFLHVYYLAFGLVGILAYCFSYILLTRQNWKLKLRQTAPLVMSAFAAVLSFKAYMWLTDPVSDRPIYPIGFLGAGVTGEDILTSNYNFIGAYAFSSLFGRAAGASEGYIYLGLITILVLLYSICRFVKSIVVRLSYQRKIPSHPIRSYRVWLLTAVLMLLFAMGVPFVWGMEFLVDYVSVFRQFRSLGRFGWIFYFIMMLYAAIVIYRYVLLLQAKQKYKQALVLCSGIVLVWIIEWNGYGMEIRKVMSEAKNTYHHFYEQPSDNWSNWLKDNGFDSKAYQGIIALPYFHIGSEKLGIQRDGFEYTFFKAAQVALSTGLGMADVMMSRTSWSQSFAATRMYDGPLTPMPIIDSFSNKPLLLLVNQNLALSWGEQYLIQQGDFLGTRNNMDVYSVSLSDYAASAQQYKDSIIHLAAHQNKKEGLLVNPTAYFHHNYYTQTLNDSVPYYYTPGAYAAKRERKDFIAEIVVADRDFSDSAFVLSAWFKIRDKEPNMPTLIYEMYDEGNNRIDSGICFVNYSTYIDRFWFKAECNVTLSNKVTTLKLYAREGLRDYVSVDNILLYPKNDIHFFKLSDKLWLINNRPVMIP